MTEPMRGIEWYLLHALYKLGPCEFSQLDFYLDRFALR
jgi:hypothetical protein